MSDAATLQILIDIRARLDALNASQQALRGVKDEAKEAGREGSRLGALFAQGLGIGSGMELARRAVDLFRASVGEAIQQSSALASEIERATNRLEISGEAYQTLAAEARAAETDFGEMVASMTQYRQRLGEALLDPQQGSVLRQLALDARDLANVPLERQLEQISVALGKVSDGNIRARLSQELFGRGATAMLPLLERLRSEGYDKLRDAAKRTNTELGEGMTNALNRANNQLEEAHRRLTVALAPINLKLLEGKTQLANFIANNAGTIQSGISAAAAYGLIEGIEKGAEKLGKSQSRYKGVGESVSDALSGTLGILAKIITTAGTFAISALARKALDADSKANEFAEKAYRTPADIQAAIPNLRNEEELRLLHNRAVTAWEEAKNARRLLLPATTDEEQEQVAILDAEIKRLAAMIPLIKERGREAIKANNVSRESFERLGDAQTDLMVIEFNHAKFQNSIQSTDEEKRKEEFIYLRNKMTLLSQIADLTEKLPLRVGEDPETRKREVLKIRGEVAALDQQMTDKATPLSDREALVRQYGKFTAGKNEAFGNRLTPSQGIEAGAMQWSMSVGTQGEQIAAGMQNSIGTTVQGISDGIYGWATGAQTFGDAVRNLQGNLLRTFLDTIVQMGVQWVVNAALAKGALLSTFLFGSSLRKAETADVIASETAKTPSIMTNAAGSSISSFGIAAAIGIAALIAAMAAFGGFAEGGFTGPGTLHEPKGIVHAQEWVAPAWMTQDPSYGPVIAMLEAGRVGKPGYKFGGFVGEMLQPWNAFQVDRKHPLLFRSQSRINDEIKGGLYGFSDGGTSSSSGASAANYGSYAVPTATAAQPVSAAPALSTSSAFSASTSAAPQKPTVIIALAKDYNDVTALKRQAGWEDAIIDVVQRRRGEILGT